MPKNGHLDDSCIFFIRTDDFTWVPRIPGLDPWVNFIDHVPLAFGWVICKLLIFGKCKNRLLCENEFSFLRGQACKSQTLGCTFQLHIMHPNEIWGVIICYGFGYYCDSYIEYYEEHLFISLVRKLCKKDSQPLSYCGSFDHPDVQSLNDYSNLFLFCFASPILTFLGYVIHRWKDIFRPFQRYITSLQIPKIPVGKPSKQICSHLTTTNQGGQKNRDGHTTAILFCDIFV